MQLSTAGRVVLGVFGALVGLVGLGSMFLEAEYGSRLNFTVEVDGEVARVYELDEQSLDTEDQSTLVFEGTEEEASAYVEQRRTEGTSYLVPGLLMAAGALVVVAALVLFRKTQPTGT